MNVVIWGIGKEFRELYNLLKLHEEIGDYKIIGYISKEVPRNVIDHISIYSPEDFFKEKIAFDYILVATDLYFSEIVDYAVNKFTLSRKKIIKASVLTIPYFNWDRYIYIYENQPSIIAENCIGGVLTNLLGLRFNSPFVNVRIGIEHDDYWKLLYEFDKYMSMTPDTMPKGKYQSKNFAGFEGRVDFPKLWYDDILIHGYHYKSTEDLLNKWEKRRNRLQDNNEFVIKMIYDVDDLEKFRALQKQNKLGFYSEKVPDDNIITLPRPGLNYVYSLAVAFTGTVVSKEPLIYFDLFKWLCGESDFKK